MENGNSIGEYRYWYHSDTDDLQKVWDKLKELDKGIRKTQGDIKIAQENLTEIDQRQLQKDIKKKEKEIEVEA
jgi:hypothetical protein